VLDAVWEREGRALVFGSGQGGYSGWSTSKEALDESAKVTDWTLHDLRRTAATRMADLGVAPHVIEAILNHISGHKAGVAGIYNRSSYAAEKRAALELWAGHLQTVHRTGGGRQRH
jgi:integrase